MSILLELSRYIERVLKEWKEKLLPEAVKPAPSPPPQPSPPPPTATPQPQPTRAEPAPQPAPSPPLPPPTTPQLITQPERPVSTPSPPPATTPPPPPPQPPPPPPPSKITPEGYTQPATTPPSPPVTVQPTERRLKLNYGEISHKVDLNMYCLVYSGYGIGANVCATKEYILNIANEIRSVAEDNIRYIDQYISYIDQGYCVCKCVKARFMVQRDCVMCRDACNKYQGGFAGIWSKSELLAEMKPYELMLDDYKAIVSFVR